MQETSKQACVLCLLLTVGIHGVSIRLIEHSLYKARTIMEKSAELYKSHVPSVEVGDETWGSEKCKDWSRNLFSLAVALRIQIFQVS